MVRFFPFKGNAPIKEQSTEMRLAWNNRFESFSTHHCWALSKYLIPSLVVWSMTKNNEFGGEKAKQKEQW